MDAQSQRRLQTVSAHLVGPGAGEPELRRVACASTSVGSEYAVPQGYSVALPEHLSSNDFNVYRCGRTGVARRGCGGLATGVSRASRVARARLAKAYPR